MHKPEEDEPFRRTVFPPQFDDLRYEDVYLADPVRIRVEVEELAGQLPTDPGRSVPAHVLPLAQKIGEALFRLAHEVEAAFVRPGFLAPVDDFVAALRHFCCEFLMMGRTGHNTEHVHYLCGDLLPVLDEVLLEDQLSA